MSHRIVHWIPMSCALALGFALVTTSADAAAPKRLGSIEVPGNTDSANAVRFPAVLEADDRYRIVVTGTVNIWPARNYMVDAVYCFDQPDFCPTPSYNNTLQWLSFVGEAYQGFAGFPSSTAYNPQHKYQRTVSYTQDTTLRFATTDTQPADNTGSFRVEIFRVPVFRFYALSCVKGDLTRWRVLSLRNGGCQSARLVAEGPEGPEGAVLDMQYRHNKRWVGMPAACNEGLPPGKCRIHIQNGGARRVRYRAIVHFNNDDRIIASKRVTINFLDTRGQASVPE